MELEKPALEVNYLPCLLFLCFAGIGKISSRGNLSLCFVMLEVKPLFVFRKFLTCSVLIYGACSYSSIVFFTFLSFLSIFCFCLSLNVTQGTSMGLTENVMEYSAERIKQEQHIVGECMTTQNQFNNISIRSASDPSCSPMNGSSSLEYSAGRIKEELQSFDGESWLAGIEFNEVPNRSASDLQRTFATGTFSYIFFN